MRTPALFLLASALLQAQPDAPLTWNAAMRQPETWYGSPEAVRIADNLLLYQFDNGGWDKNIDMAAPVDEARRRQLLRDKASPRDHTTIDNGATYTQMQYLAKVYAATGEPRFAEAFLHGLRFLLEAQYPNGGWPQYYPLRDGYWSRITYNDNAMISVMELLGAVARAGSPYAFVPAADRERAVDAVARGLQCILKSQVVVGGRRTAWCAQHDEHTLAPAEGRTYELVSLSGSESVGLVRYLMSIEAPSGQIIQAVQGAIAWFSAVEIRGFRYANVKVQGAPGGTDRVLAADPAAPPLWARFYEIPTNRPIFSGRDGVKKYAVHEIEHERRTGYAWYGTWPAALLAQDYPRWMEKWAPGSDAGAGGR